MQLERKRAIRQQCVERMHKYQQEMDNFRAQQSALSSLAAIRTADAGKSLPIVETIPDHKYSAFYDKLNELLMRCDKLQEENSQMEVVSHIRNRLQSVSVDSLAVDSNNAYSRLLSIELNEILPQEEQVKKLHHMSELDTTHQAVDRHASPKTEFQRKTLHLSFAKSAPTVYESSDSIWNDFCQRTNQMIQLAGHTPLPAMIAFADAVKSVEPSSRNDFMLKSEEELSRLEEQAANIAKLHNDTEKGEVLSAQYSFLCTQLNVEPQNFTSTEALEVTVQTMFEQYCEQQEDLYIEDAIRIVFLEFGIHFDTFEHNAHHATASTPLAEGTELSIQTDNIGSFSIETYGVTDSQTLTQAEKSQVHANSVNFCKMFPHINQRLQDFGVYMQGIEEQEPDANNVRIRPKKTHTAKHYEQERYMEIK